MSSSSSTSRNQLQVTHVPVAVLEDNKLGGDSGIVKTVWLRKCSFFEWKDEEQADGIAEVEFLLSQEQYKVAKSEKEVHDAMKAIGRYRMIVALLVGCLDLCVLKLGGSM
ncbi:unnamed protein product [Lactuca saligna]|uniref:Uncharacterized protein n=1 Tax=Lactuca saligna TaxID=75948 RepID=A0AA35VMR1_LACSI|nr:unnamed protein product [Lactuca saligna]